LRKRGDESKWKNEASKKCRTKIDWMIQGLKEKEILIPQTMCLRSKWKGSTDKRTLSILIRGFERLEILLHWIKLKGREFQKSLSRKLM